MPAEGITKLVLVSRVPNKKGSTTLYVFGNWESRFNIKVVLPLPKKPVTTVTGVGGSFIDSIKSKDMIARCLVNEWSLSKQVPPNAQ